MKKHLLIFSFLLLACFSIDAIAQKKNKKNKKSKSSKAIAGNENKAEFLFIKGEGLYIQHEYAKAIGFFNEALNLSPNNAAIHYKLSESYHYGGIPVKAIEHIEKAIAIDKKIFSFYLLQADINMNELQFDKAAAAYEALIQNVEKTEEYNYELGELYFEIVKSEQQRKDIYKQNNLQDPSREKEIKKNIEEKSAKAIAAYSRAEKHFGAHEDLTFKKQRLYLSLNNVDDAIKEGKSLIESFPDEIRYKLNQGELIYSNNRKQEAIEYMLRVIKEHPNEASPLLVISDFYKGNNQQDKANEYLELAFTNPQMDVDAKVKMISMYLQFISDEDKKQTAINLAERTVLAHPTKSQAHSIYGDVLYMSKQKEKARDAYFTAVSLDPSHYLIWQQVVVLDAELNQNDSLVKHSEIAITHFKEKPLLWMYNGLGLQLLKNDNKAIISYKKGRELAKDDPEMESQFNTQLGDAYNNIKAYSKSDSAYTKALEFDPNNAHVLNNYSYFLSLRNEKLEEAKAMSGKVVRMHPKEATYLDTYAWVLYKLKEYKEAKKYLERALESTSDGTVTEHYGDVLFKLGNTEEALKNWKKAKIQGGTSDLLDKKIRDKKLYE